MTMITKQNTYNSLICLTLISFGVFGSLSHIFSLCLIILAYFSQRISEGKLNISFKAKVLFWSLTGCFFLFFINGIFRTDFASLLYSLSPMLPLLFVSTLLIFDSGSGLKLSPKKVSQYSQISVSLCLLLYLFLNTFLGDSEHQVQKIYVSHDGSLKLFSGNSIPFSFALMGVSLFCLFDWKNSEKQNRLLAFVCFAVGAYFATFLSGSRGTLLSLIVTAPIILFYLSSNLAITIIFSTLTALICLFLFYLDTTYYLEAGFFIHIKNGLNTLFLMDNGDSSILERLNMWSAANKAFFDAPIIGHSVTERFNALKPYLLTYNINYSHPHNDILAALVSIGFLGGIAALISIMGGLLAAILAPHLIAEKVCLGLIISIQTFITASVSTVFFNDICSAWLAFSSYLIWSADFKRKHGVLLYPKQ